jgi:hypothetical protein
MTDEYVVPCVSPGAAAPRPSAFISDVEPMNVAPYICRCHITDKCIVNSSVLMKMLGYVRRPYIYRPVHQLADEFAVYSLI